MKKLLATAFIIMLMSACSGGSGGAEKSKGAFDNPKETDLQGDMATSIKGTTWHATFPGYSPQGEEINIDVLIKFNADGTYIEDWGELGGISQGTYSVVGDKLSITGEYLAFAGSGNFSVFDNGQSLSLIDNNGQNITFSKNKKESSQQLVMQENADVPEQAYDQNLDIANDIITDAMGNEIDISDWPDYCLIDGADSAQATKLSDPNKIYPPSVFVSYGDGIIYGITDKDDAYVCEYTIPGKTPYPTVWYNAICQMEIKCGQYNVKYYLNGDNTWRLSSFPKYPAVVWKFAKADYFKTSGSSVSGHNACISGCYELMIGQQECVNACNAAY